MSEQPVPRLSRPRTSAASMRSAFSFASMTVLFALPVSAQNWSPEQREVIDHVQRCWETWEDGLAAWEEACPHAEDRVFWFTADDVPKTNWSNFGESIQYFMDSEESEFFEHRPLYVAIHGDVASYAYWVFRAVRDAGGQPTTISEKRLESFRRVGGQWLFISGMAVPVN